MGINSEAVAQMYLGLQAVSLITAISNQLKEAVLATNPEHKAELLNAAIAALPELRTAMAAYRNQFSDERSIFDKRNPDYRQIDRMAPADLLKRVLG